MIRHVAALAACLAATPAAADMIVEFINDSPVYIEWLASPSSVSHVIAPSGRTSLPTTRDPVTVQIRTSGADLCEGVASFTPGAGGSPATCRMNLSRYTGTGPAADVMCVSYELHPGGANCTAGVRVVRTPR